MAINFPTSLDVFTDPTASDQLNLPSHSGQHTDLNNAVEALEAKVGADSSAVTTSHDYKIAQLEARNTAGLVLISRTTIGTAVSSVTVSGAFSTDYDNYKIVVGGGTQSTSCDLRLTLGSTVTGYYQAGRVINYQATTSDIHDENVAYWRLGTGGVTLSGEVTLYGPFLSNRTGASTLYFGTRGDAYEGYMGGYLADTTSYTAFTLTASAGTMTGGTIDVYGYAKA